MKLRFARGLLVCVLGVTALVGSTGVAGADPDDATPPIIDDFLILIPALTLNPLDRDGPKRDWGGVGMYCQNPNVHCQKGGF
jgi:hypothetical protein